MSAAERTSEAHAQAAREIGLERAPKMWIDGISTGAMDGACFATFDATTGEELAQLPAASESDVDGAVRAARRAFEQTDWHRNSTLRARTLQSLARLAKRDRDHIALLDCLEVGAVRGIARRLGAQALVRNLEYFASWADKIYGEVVPVPSGRVLDYARREPYGVVAAITAWNTPALFVGSKLGPALAAGNTVVLKPSEFGSLSALHFAKLCAEAEIPPGVVNIVSGGAATGEALIRHPDVAKITFTGGTGTGRRIQAAAADNLVPVHLELGGKSPHVVLADADLDQAVGGVIAGGFGLSGQTCAAGSRLILQREIHDAFLEKLSDAVSMLSIGDPLDPKTFLGPLIHEQHLERVLGYVASGIAEGAELVVGGKRAEFAGPFMQATLFSGVESEMRIACEEIFGPVLSVMCVEDAEQAARVANETRYGLGAGIWTRDVKTALRFAESVRAGNVWVNQYGSLPHTVPFGGYGHSGQGREGGRQALEEYTQIKNVSIDLG
ncbi:MAG: aldehyde dehydrogenase family protein [Myxococcota bacterium]|jgi:acyl-CoA reductase-like NAD-dependent aldehyde dehydrogenase|nr:aldehyde dehydrogenase family protein [Myxococcota bacterium]